MKETGLNVYVYDFSVNYFRINVGAIQDIHKYLMNKNNIKQLFTFLKKAFIILLTLSISLTYITNASGHTIGIS